MNMIYNSSNYCVVEFASYPSLAGTDAEANKPANNGGFEIMDKTAKREIFLGGELADHFRQNVAELIASEPSVEEIDEFLSRFDPMMHQSLTIH
jgi:hypothetical protein